ncbi:Delta(9)-fatty-acid desaturase fat-7 [Halotydeus destructor]|nr:Delta(9)-fatty-acid desaturase fat-7 [Halotydeus destructor]
MKCQRYDVNNNCATSGARDGRHYYFIGQGDFDIVWSNVAVFAVGHLLFLAYIYVVMVKFPMATLAYNAFLITIIGMGVTAGAHRLWAHRSYQARLPYRILVMLGQTLSGQNCIHIWARDHRVHHKWSDTDGDPHNTKRGFFFAHCGWLMRRKHPEMVIKSKTLDYSDLDNDPVVKFQKDHYWLLYFIFSLVIPVAIPVILWQESWYVAFLCCYINRYIITLHGTWFVNSAAHMFGDRPFNDKMQPVENVWVSLCAMGEGYHNYHHQYPNDYRASESGTGINFTRHFIDKMAALGQVYNLKMAADSVVEADKAKTWRAHILANKGCE